MILKLKDGNVIIELYSDIAPNHVKRFKQLAKEKKYDGVVFHRVIDNFMAQTGDVEFGNSNSPNFDISRAHVLPIGVGDCKIGRTIGQFRKT